MPDVPRARSYQENRENRSCQTVTVFIDLLGIREKLVCLDEINAKGLTKEQATPLIQESLGAILRLRRSFEEMSSIFERSEPPASLPEPLRSEWTAMTAGDTRLFWVSDSAMINQIISMERLLATYRDTLMLLLNLAICTLDLAARGQLIRGGVEMGWALDNGGQEIIGSGSAHAYKLETTVAHHPRICFGARFLEFLAVTDSDATLASLNCPSREVAAVRGAVGFIRQLLILDPDGVTRLNFMSPLVVNGFVAGKTPSLLVLARDKIATKLHALDPATEAGIVSKYAWMLNALGVQP